MQGDQMFREQGHGNEGTDSGWNVVVFEHREVVVQSHGVGHIGREAPSLGDDSPHHRMVCTVRFVLHLGSGFFRLRQGMGKRGLVALDALQHHRDAHIAKQSTGMCNVSIHAVHLPRDVTHGIGPAGRRFPKVFEQGRLDPYGLAQQKARQDGHRLRNP